MDTVVEAIGLAVGLLVLGGLLEVGSRRLSIRWAFRGERRALGDLDADSPEAIRLRGLTADRIDDFVDERFHAYSWWLCFTWLSGVGSLLTLLAGPLGLGSTTGAGDMAILLVAAPVAVLVRFTDRVYATSWGRPLFVPASLRT